jgi:hypothetical protein
MVTGRRAGSDVPSARVSRLSSVPERQRLARVFSGEVLVFSPAPDAFQRLRGHAAGLVQHYLGDMPLLAHSQLPRARFLRAVLEVQRAFSADPVIRDAWRATLDALGVSRNVFGDQRFLRVLPPQSGPVAGRVAPLHPHRDTWGSQVMQQENWWAPITPLSARSTLALYPRHWHEPIANDSDEWSFERYQQHRRQAGDAGPVGYRSAPAPLHLPAPQDAEPLLIEPGELALFSGAHLHASVPNRSGLCRFSFETRTVVLGEDGLGPGAPNVDGQVQRPRLEWFRDQAGRTLAAALGA